MVEKSDFRNYCLHMKVNTALSHKRYQEPKGFNDGKLECYCTCRISFLGNNQYTRGWNTPHGTPHNKLGH